MMSLQRVRRCTDYLWISYSQRRFCHVVRKCVSQMFQNLGQNPPKDSQSTCKSQKLMMYNDIIQSCHPGGFHILPLGQRVLDKLIKVIDEELNSIGCQKISMTSLAPSSLWKKTGRWESTGPELFRLQDRHKQDYCLGPTHEELVTNLFSQVHTISYRKLPVKLYQISRKFRDEMHPRFGLLRGREFEMKDLYTFDASEENAIKTYEEVCSVYEKIFNRLGLQFKKVLGATGNIGGTLSHEYVLPSPIGEDTILTCNSCGYGRNVEVKGTNQVDNENQCPDCGNNMDKLTAIEVGHSFFLGTKYSEVLEAKCIGEDKKPMTTQMGCFGLGVTRILQASIEVLSDEDTIRWPQLIAPYQICIVPQMKGYMEQKFTEVANDLYDELVKVPSLRGEVVIDDRTKLTVGRRVYEAERIGYPHIIVIGKSALDPVPTLELQNVYSRRKDFLPQSEIISLMSRLQTV